MSQETLRIQLTYPLEWVHEPILYRLVMEFDLIPNIRRADVDPHSGGFISLELQGERENLDSALHFLHNSGIEVNLIGLDSSDEWAI